MVKTLVLVRHGAPEAAAASGADLDRRLTASGARALRTAYPRTFALLGDDAQVEVWSSPAVRALETADVVAASTGAQDIEVH
ncbi:MAG TPA: histidine phosphatase family protein, partial [Candidatus Olsenella avistercoris]|nr:histidine phosphatase family protein [Candidatus Olsenella avistercoris]